MKLKNAPYTSLQKPPLNYQSIENFLSELDGQRFGFKIAKINSWPDNRLETIAALKAMGVKLIISKIECDKIQLINELEALAFCLKDVQLTYKYTCSALDLEIPVPLPQIEIRDVRAEDVPEVQAVAYEAFLGYGHYFANEKLDKAICAQIYPDWALRCCTDANFADKTVVAVSKEKVVGFMAFKIHQHNAIQFATANISGVFRDYRGRGIYQALMKNGFSWCAANNCLWVEGNALVTNYPVNYALFKLGFKMQNSFATLHAWLS